MNESEQRFTVALIECAGEQNDVGAVINEAILWAIEDQPMASVIVILCFHLRQVLEQMPEKDRADAVAAMTHLISKELSPCAT